MPISNAINDRLDQTLSGGMLWQGCTLPGEAGILRIGEAAMAELREVAALLAANPLPTIALRHQDFALESCRAMMREASTLLAEAPGFVILDRLPVAELGTTVATRLYWLLASMVARPVAQKWDGTMIYDVTDKGKPPGPGIRPDITNAEQNYHCDNSYNICPPDYVALFCLQTAMEGGVSGLVSFYAALTEMRRRHPELIEPLFQPYIYDRQREHAPDDAMVIERPMFAWEETGRLRGRLSRFQIVNGHALAGRPMTPEAAEALDRFNEVMHEPALRKDFWFEPGQIQIVNNAVIGHRRTGFRDWPEQERKRHLVRLWLRDGGRVFYNG